MDSKVIFLKSDLLDVFMSNQIGYPCIDRNVLITANLPYIKDEDWVNMSSDTRDEPKMALF
jgi:methylase of polypeptide subunit release factors